LGDNVNPDKESSGSQFYIVQGALVDSIHLKQSENNIISQKKQELFHAYIMRSENLQLRNKIDSLRKAGDKNGLNIISQQIQKDLEPEMMKIPQFRYTDDQYKIYSGIGGTPHLDMSYTVFGEVTEGLDVLDKIANVPCNGANRPIDDIRIISMKILP